MIYNLFPKFHWRHEGFSFYGPRKADEGADTDLIGLYHFCWHITCHHVVCKQRQSLI